MGELMMRTLEGSYHAPGVDDFTLPDLFGIPGFNKAAFQAIIAAALVIILWVWGARGLKVRPTKRQFAMEYLYEFVRNGIARDILGREYRKYLPYLLALFSFLLVNNWFGEFFVFMFPTFSKVGYAYGLALLSWIIYIVAGFARHGMYFLKKSVLPKGVPWPLWILIIPLEFLSNFITRPVTLALRLFANMFAGHLSVAVFVGGGAYLLTYAGGKPLFNAVGALSLLFSVAILGLELLIGALQAYIFTVLTAQYVSASLADDH